MKSLVATLVLAAFIIGVCSAGIYYVDHTAQTISSGLQECIDHAENEDITKAKEALQTVQLNWQKKRNILMMYTDQEILDDVDDQLEHLEALADHHKEEFVPTAILCLGKLKELKQREMISIYSWF